MRLPAIQKLFLAVLAGSGAFVWLTSRGLPPVVASHFSPGGGANGYMAKGVYTVIMLTLVIALPAVIASSILLIRALPTQLINLPNRRYWLAPERRAASLDALGSLGTRFALALAIFLCFVHGLVVQANSVQPPKLDEAWFFAGLTMFAVATLAWVFSLFRRFGRPAGAP